MAYLTCFSLLGRLVSNTDTMMAGAQTASLRIRAKASTVVWNLFVETGLSVTILQTVEICFFLKQRRLKAITVLGVALDVLVGRFGKHPIKMGKHAMR